MSLYSSQHLFYRRSDFFANVTDPTCGEHLQLASLYPGRGPCYPVVVETVDYFNRCISFPLCLLALPLSQAPGKRCSGCMHAGKPACEGAPALSAWDEGPRPRGGITTAGYILEQNTSQGR